MLELATRLRISNVWLLEWAGERYLFDTGHVLERPWLKRTLWAWGVRAKGDLRAVVLTHRHSDHASNAAWLRRTYDAPIVCHEADARILMGAAPPPAMCGLARQRLHENLLCRIEDRFPARVAVDEELSEGAWRDIFTIVHAPGHTEGSMMIEHRPTRTLFSGDAILAGVAPLRAFERLGLAVPGFSLEVDTCHAHVRRYLRELDRPIERLCSGHGPLVACQTLDKLRQL